MELDARYVQGESKPALRPEAHTSSNARIKVERKRGQVKPSRSFDMLRIDERVSIPSVKEEEGEKKGEEKK